MRPSSWDPRGKRPRQEGEDVFRQGLAIIVTFGCLAAVAGPAAAERYTSWVGDPQPAPKSAPQGTVLRQFFPAKLTLRQGDTVRYRTRGGDYAVVVPGRDSGFLPENAMLPAPDGSTYAGITDPQGN